MLYAIGASILIPIATSIAVLAIPGRVRGVREALSFIAALATLAVTLTFYGRESFAMLSWAGFGAGLSFRVYSFSAFLIIATAFFAVMVILYSSVFMRGKQHAKLFYSFLLLSLGFVNGGLLTDNLVALLFFWEGLLFTVYGMIAIGNRDAFKTATKAFIVVGVGDLFMVLGAALAYHLTGTLTISGLHVEATGLGALAFGCLMIGAIAKAGSMPFHSWIPNAAVDAPLPFMALAPASLDKLFGIYFLTRITVDIFRLQPASWASYGLMTIGAITILLAVMMALVQKDYKKLLSYHAISQVGYMVLGIGTATPAGIVGGIFHMINNALYKSGLFLTAGSVERQTGTTDLEKLGGLGMKMPVTFACFIITALAISGVPPFNGFFSKELVYDGAIERGSIFYLAAIIGSFLTAASFLKLGHAAFLGKARPDHSSVRESPVRMLVPMIIIAGVCILFGLRSSIPIHLILPVLQGHVPAHELAAGFAPNHPLIIITVVVIICAVLNHIFGVLRTGSGLKAADHIHYAPLLKPVYDRAEKGAFDPYTIGMRFVGAFAVASAAIDRAVNWIYDTCVPSAAAGITRTIQRLHDGSYRTYLLWSVVATVVIVLVMINGLR